MPLETMENLDWSEQQDCNELVTYSVSVALVQAQAAQARLARLPIATAYRSSPGSMKVSSSEKKKAPPGKDRQGQGAREATLHSVHRRRLVDKIEDRLQGNQHAHRILTG